MFREMIDEFVYLFGDMKPIEVVKEFAMAVALFGLMWANIIIYIIAFG